MFKLGGVAGNEYRRGNIASARKPIQNHTVYLLIDSSPEKARSIVEREDLTRGESALRSAKGYRGDSRMRGIG